MWSAEELRRQKKLDERARRTNNESHWLLADMHFNHVARQYDRLTPEASRFLKAQLVIETVEILRRYHGQKNKFVRRRIDEAAHNRWLRASDAREFLRR